MYLNVCISLTVLVLNIIEVTLKRSLLTGNDLSIEPTTTTTTTTTTDSVASVASLHDSFSRKSSEVQLSTVKNPVLPPRARGDETSHELANKIDALALQMSTLKEEIETRLVSLEEGAGRPFAKRLTIGGDEKRSNSVHDELPPSLSSIGQAKHSL